MKKTIDKSLSISIITGFLGSGKTSFFNHYIKGLLKNNEKPAIIVNEFGDFNVDGHLVNGDIETATILNGCVCCELNQDLVQQLNIFNKRGDIDHIIIEATGIAEPLEIIAACQDPSIVNDIEQPFVITLIDALRYVKRDQYTSNVNGLMERQIKYGDLLLVNKMDLITEQDQEVLQNIKQLNPTAHYIETTYGQISDTEWSQTQDHAQLAHTHHHSHHGINSMKYTFTGPIQRQLFNQFILRLPENVLRLKGFVSFKDQPERVYTFQFSGLFPEYEEIDAKVPLTVVLIGEQLDEDRLRNQLDMLEFT